MSDSPSHRHAAVSRASDGAMFNCPHAIGRSVYVGRSLRPTGCPFRRRWGITCRPSLTCRLAHVCRHVTISPGAISRMQTTIIQAGERNSSSSSSPSSSGDTIPRMSIFNAPRNNSLGSNPLSPGPTPYTVDDPWGFASAPALPNAGSAAGVGAGTGAAPKSRSPTSGPSNLSSSLNGAGSASHDRESAQAAGESPVH